MRRSWAAVTVGALVVIIAVSAVLLFRYTKEGIGGEDSYAVWALFDDAIGINTKTQVRTAGIDIGEIVGKRLQDGRARIDIRISETSPLWSNALVTKKSASLLGEFYLEIDPGTEWSTKAGQKVHNTRLKDGDQIMDVIESATVSSIMDQVNETMPTLRLILEDVRELTSGQVKEIATNVNEMVAKNSVVLERLLQRVDNIAAHVEEITVAETDDIKQSLANIRDITEGVKQLVGKSEGEVTATGGELRSSLTKLQSSVDKLDKSLDNMQTVTTRLKEGEGTAGRLLTDDTIARNVEDITEDAGGFIKGLTRLQTSIGLRSEYNYLAGQFKNYFQVIIAPRPDKYYLLEIVDDPRGNRQALTRTVDNSKEGSYSERVIETSESLRFSFQFAKRIGFFTGRFGLKESTGGAGVDGNFFQDRFILSLDVFDTRSNEYPRVQVRGQVAVYKENLFLVAGADDLLNYEPATTGAGGAFFDWFFGLKLVFRETDLKSMLLFGGSAVGAAAGSK